MQIDLHNAVSLLEPGQVDITRCTYRFFILEQVHVLLADDDLNVLGLRKDGLKEKNDEEITDMYQECFGHSSAHSSLNFSPQHPSIWLFLRRFSLLVHLCGGQEH